MKNSRSFRWLLAFIGLVLFPLLAPLSVAHAGDCLAAVQSAGCLYGLPADQYQSLLAVMAANPQPPVHPLAPDDASIKQYSVMHTSEVRRPSSFTGVMVDGPLPYPMAWVISADRPSALPGQRADAATPVLPRYSRVYIFAMLKAKGWKWYLVGPGQWLQQTS